MFGTLKATQAPANIENPEQDVNVELFEFQDSLHCTTHEEDSLQAFKSRRGCAIKPSSHKRRRRRFVQ